MKLLKILLFALFYLKEVVACNFRVAFDVLTKKHYMHPGFVAIPVDDLNDRQLMILANLLSMTPGSVTIDIAYDKKHLFVHAMYIDDLEALRNEITEKYVKRVKEVF